MNIDITLHKLHEFIDVAQNQNIEFARYAYECGATNFIKMETEYDWKAGKLIRKYEFKDLYINPENFEYLPYYVLSVPNKSYLMFELYSEIFIWVCYTEESYRKQGNISKLLKHLKESYPYNTITIDTYNEALRKYSQSIGINLFRN